MKTIDLKPVRCGCGGEANVETDHDTIQPVATIDWKRVVCTKCNIRTTWRSTESEAITAWNMAMGNRMELQTVKERTAKVGELEKRSETMIGWEGICTNCGAYTLHEMNFCFQCGCRLEWE